MAPKVENTAAVTAAATTKTEVKKDAAKTEVKQNTVFDTWSSYANSGLGSFGMMGVGLGTFGGDPALEAVPAYQNAVSSIYAGLSNPFGGQSNLMQGFKALYDYFFNNKPQTTTPGTTTQTTKDGKETKPGAVAMTDEEVAKSAKELHDKLSAKRKEAVSEDDIKAMLKDKGLDKTKAVLGLSDKEEKDGKSEKTGKTGRHHHTTGAGSSEKTGKKPEVRTDEEGNKYETTYAANGDKIEKKYNSEKDLVQIKTYYKADNFRSYDTKAFSAIKGTTCIKDERVYTNVDGYRVKNFKDVDGNTYINMYKNGKYQKTSIYYTNGSSKVVTKEPVVQLMTEAQLLAKKNKQANSNVAVKQDYSKKIGNCI